MEERIIDPVPQTDEEPSETSLRPQSLDEFVGQDAIKRNLRVFIKAAKGRSDALDHVLFHGSPGLGKTSLANIIANDLTAVPIPIAEGYLHVQMAAAIDPDVLTGIREVIGSGPDRTDAGLDGPTPARELDRSGHRKGGGIVNVRIA